MPPKKQTDTTTPDAQTADVVNAQITESLGTRPHKFVTTGPVIVGKVGMNDLVEIKQKTVVQNLAQPILNLEEATVLGKQEWTPHTPKPGHHKVIVNGRRFVVTDEVYKQLKVNGLVL